MGFVRRITWTTFGVAIATTLSCGSGSGGSGGALAGKYDLTGSSPSDKRGTMTLEASTFTIAMGDTTLAYRVSGNQITLTWTERSRVSAITTTRTPGALFLGDLPLNVGGSWTLAGEADPTQKCSASFAAASIDASCSNVSGVPSPLPHINGMLTGGRKNPLASIFGDLGGEWTLSATGGGGATAKFSGNTFSGSITGSGRADGSVTVTIANGIASGTTNKGIEFSARHL